MSDLPTRYYAVVNNLIGGWDVSKHDKPTGDHRFDEGERTVGTFMTEEDARRVADLLSRVEVADGVAVRMRDCDQCDDGYWPKYVGDGSPDEDFMAFSRDKDCPTCGGSGVVPDTDAVLMTPGTDGWERAMVVRLEDKP